MESVNQVLLNFVVLHPSEEGKIGNSQFPVPKVSQAWLLKGGIV